MEATREGHEGSGETGASKAPRMGTALVRAHTCIR